MYVVKKKMICFLDVCSSKGIRDTFADPVVSTMDSIINQPKKSLREGVKDV